MCIMLRYSWKNLSHDTELLLFVCAQLHLGSSASRIQYWNGRQIIETRDITE